MADYQFQGGYPTPTTVKRTYDQADRNRAVQLSSRHRLTGWCP